MKITVYVLAFLLFLPLRAGAKNEQSMGETNSLKNKDKRIALVIGNANYKSGILKNPANDAELISETLKKLGFEVMYGQARTNLDFAEMNIAVDDFGRELKNAGTAMFFYSGHGAQYQGRNYLLPVDAEIQEGNELPFRALDAGLVLAKMETAGTVLNLVVLDACRSNPYRNWRSAENGLAKMEAPEGTKIIYAASPGGLAKDGTGKNSPFSASLSRHMLTPGMEIEKVIRKVALDVKRETGGKQLPWAEGILLGDFYFAASSGDQPEEVHPSAPPPPSEPEPGVLKIVLKPDVSGARVRINGSDYGEQRDFFIKQKGNYSVEVSADGYETYRTEAETGPGVIKTVTAIMEKKAPVIVPVTPPVPTVPVPEPGILKIVLEPDMSEARVRINGQDYGEQREIPIRQKGNCIVEVSAEGYETYRTETEAGPGMTKTVTAAMEKKALPVIQVQHTPAVPVPQQESLTDTQKKITNSIGQEFIYIEPGILTRNQMRTYLQEMCTRVTKGFYMQTTEVTQGQWKAVMGNNPSHFKDCGDDCPVENVSWNDTQEFIRKLNRKEGKEYRLPTEAEWEYAARAGSAAAFHWGNWPDCTKANYGNGWGTECKDRNPGKTMKVKSFPANKWGLYDMHGNVSEWCQDWYGDYSDTAVTDPTGPSSGSMRVVRGGSWYFKSEFCRVDYRSSNSPGSQGSILGFRLVLIAVHQ